VSSLPAPLVSGPSPPLPSPPLPSLRLASPRLASPRLASPRLAPVHPASAQLATGVQAISLSATLFPLRASPPALTAAAPGPSLHRRGSSGPQGLRSGFRGQEPSESEVDSKGAVLYIGAVPQYRRPSRRRGGAARPPPPRRTHPNPSGA
jgi:hypothetical protein